MKKLNICLIALAGFCLSNTTCMAHTSPPPVYQTPTAEQIEKKCLDRYNEMLMNYYILFRQQASWIEENLSPQASFCFDAIQNELGLFEDSFKNACELNKNGPIHWPVFPDSCRNGGLIPIREVDPGLI